MLQIPYFTIVIDAIMSVKLVTTIIPNIAQVEGSIVEKKKIQIELHLQKFTKVKECSFGETSHYILSLPRHMHT